MITLGINAAYHDSAACVVVDGRVVAAAEEERFTRIKHGKRPVPFTAWELPFHAIDYCLAEAGTRLVDVDHVAYSYDPALFAGGRLGDATVTLPLEPSAQPNGEWDSPWDPLFVSYVRNAPRQLADGAPLHLRGRLAGATATGPYRWHFVEHHLAHEASAFLAAPFDACAVLTLDGRGERATTSYGLWRDGTYRRIGQVDVPDSLGLLYEDVTRHLGFLHSSDEYKVMALASYGRPTHAGAFRRMVRWAGDGRYTTERGCLVEALGPARARGQPFEERHHDIARSLQVVLEETALEMAAWLHRATRCENLAMAGGVALNCVMNARIRDDGPFERVWVQPAAGDAGTALGAALWIDHRERGTKANGRRWAMHDAYLGPQYRDDEIEAFLAWSKLPYTRPARYTEAVAERLASGKIVGWFQGRMEFGPRALGARSILASPIPQDMQARLNEIKDREDFRPVAPAVLEEKAHLWFEGCTRSPFMLFTYGVVNERADRVPAIRHVDGTARVQTVAEDQHPLYHRLLRDFEARTGVPVLVNTSFNTRGEPIVCSPRDAVECFWSSPLDSLAIGPFLLDKP
jgi:carbamoyltransferase